MTFVSNSTSGLKIKTGKKAKVISNITFAPINARSIFLIPINLLPLSPSYNFPITPDSHIVKYMLHQLLNE